MYPNVFIETAVNFADEPYPRDLPTARYPVPGGRAVLQKIRDAGVLDKALFGSDGTFILTLVRAMRLTSCFVYRELERVRGSKRFEAHGGRRRGPRVVAG